MPPYSRASNEMLCAMQFVEPGIPTNRTGSDNLNNVPSTRSTSCWSAAITGSPSKICPSPNGYCDGEVILGIKWTDGAHRNFAQYRAFFQGKTPMRWSKSARRLNALFPQQQCKLQPIADVS